MKLFGISESEDEHFNAMIVRNTYYDAIACIKDILSDYDDFEWDRMLYRCGGPGSYYHVASEGAAFYNSFGECKQYKMPELRKCLVFDEDGDMFKIIAGLTNQTVDDLVLAGTWVEDIDECLPTLRDLGYDGAIIHGETGRDVTGPPVEVIVF